MSPELERFSYDNKIVLYFAYATAFWGLIGMSVGLLAALQMVFPVLNFTAETTFGRIRPLHTNAVIFAFVFCVFGVVHSVVFVFTVFVFVANVFVDCIFVLCVISIRRSSQKKTKTVATANHNT